LQASSRLRAGLLFAALAATCAAAMYWPGNILLLLLALPILILIAFDFGLAGAEFGLALTALLLVGGVLLGFRPNFGAEGPREDISRLQIMLALLSAGILPLAALVEQKQKLYESASHAIEEAQQAWGDIIAAEANYRLLADSTRAFVLRINADGMIASASASSPLLGYDPHDLEGSYLSAYLDETGVAALRDALVTIDPSAENARNTLQLRIRGRDNSWRMFEAVVTRPPSSAARQRDLILILSPVD
jgi:PAS domain-containing protein